MSPNTGEGTSITSSAEVKARLRHSRVGILGRAFVREKSPPHQRPALAQWLEIAFASDGLLDRCCMQARAVEWHSYM